MKKITLLIFLLVIVSSSILSAQDHPFTSFSQGVDGVVTAVATDPNGDLFVGGMSSVAGTTDIQNIAMYDGTEWTDIGRTGLFTTFVRDMLVAGEYLYVAFQRSSATSSTNEIITPGGATISVESGLGAYHIPSGTWVEVELPDDERYNFFSLTSNGATAYAGTGRIFKLVNGVADYVAPGNPYAEWGFGGGPLHALEYHDGKLYAGGRFARLYNHEDDEDPTIETRHVAVFNLATNSWEAMGEGFSDPVYSLHITGEGTIYAGGEMEEILNGEDPIPTNRFAKWDGAGNWEPVAQGIDPENSSSRIESITSEGENVFVGGRFDYVLQADGTEVETGNFAVWNGQQWALDAHGNSITGSGSNWELRDFKSENISTFISRSNLILQDRVYKIHNHDGEIYLGGSFDRMRTGPDLNSRVNALNVVKYHDEDYSAIGNGVDDIIFDVVKAGEDYYLTGIFVYGYNQGERVKLNGVAKYNTSEDTFEPLGEGIGECLLMGPGYRECTSYGSLLIYDEDQDDLYVAGRFLGGYQTGGSFVDSPMAVRWDGSSWQAMGNGLTPKNDLMDHDAPWQDKRWIFDMQREENKIYYAGVFQEIDGGNTDGKLAAAWDMEESRWEGIPLPEDYDVPSLRSVTFSEKSIYFSARIPDPQDLERFPIVRYDRETNTSERFNFAAGALWDTRVNNIISEGDFLYVFSNGISMVTIDEVGVESASLNGDFFIYDKINQIWTTTPNIPKHTYRTVKRGNSIYTLTSYNNGQYQSGSSPGNEFFALHLGTTPEVIEEEKRGGFFGASLLDEDSILLTGSFISPLQDNSGKIGRTAMVRPMNDQKSGAVPILFEQEIQKEVFTENSEMTFQLPVGNLGNEGYSGNFSIEYVEDSDWISVSDITLDAASSGTADYVVDAGDLQPGAYNAVITLNSDNPEIDAISINFNLLVDPLRRAWDPLPEDDMTDVPLDTDLEWTNDEETTSVTIYFSEDVNELNNNNILYEGSTVDELSSLPELSYNATYYWQVISENEDETTAGDIWSFSTITGPDELVTLISPENEATDTETDVELIWQNEAPVDYYDLQLATDDQFDELVTDISNVYSTSYSLNDLEENETYYWRVGGNVDDQFSWSDTWSFTTAMPTSIDSGDEIPKQTFIDQNYPNPFNPSTTIQYGVSEAADVTLSVYNIIGRRVAVLVQEPKNPGYYSISFNASSLSSGIYFYRFETGSFIETKKLTLIK